MEDPIQINGGFFHSPERASEITGLGKSTFCAWTRAQVTGYGFDLKTVEHRGHRLVDERDVLVVAAVQKAFPVPKGRIPSDTRDQMKRMAERLHATLNPTAG
jgi:hypothetical protein